MDFHITSEYQAWLAAIKSRIVARRIKAALSANSELIQLYYELGARIVEREKNAEWGSGFIDGFSRDLKQAFPDITGFSPKNLRYCRAFYRFYHIGKIHQSSVAKVENENGDSKWQQPVAKIENAVSPEISRWAADQIPWGHNIQIFTKTTHLDEAVFYITQTIQNGWSRDVLTQKIKSDLYSRTGRAVSNFEQTLPAARSELVEQTLKDPYVFDFFSMTAPYNERDIERQLVKHITKFLLELGKGFAFVGQQHTIEVDGTDYFIDLLFYHTVLKCYVVVELKNTKFVPEYAGKLNFYLSAVDSLVKLPDDNPTIGLLLCRDKSNVEVEFALRDMNKPMGVSEYNLTEVLPDELKGSLPTVEEIEADLKRLDESTKKMEKVNSSSKGALE